MMLLFFHILIALQTICARNITIVTMIIEGFQPYHLGRSGPALDIAIEKVSQYFPSNLNVTFVRSTYPSDSCHKDVAAIAARLYYTHDVTAFIGPGCSPAVEIVGRMASSWNIPLISPVATNGILGNKKDFTTLTRLAYNMNKWAQIYITLLQEYNWKDIAIIHDTGFVYFTIVGESIDKALDTVGMRVYRQFYNSKQKYDMEKLLRRASEKSRVFIISCYGDDFRKFMLLAQRIGMTDGDYVFMFSYLFKGSNIGDMSWRRGDGYDMLAKKAYESVLFTQPSIPDSTEYLDFENDVKLRALNHYNYSYGNDTEVNIFVTAFHDAVLVYALALNDTLAKGEDYTDGKFMNTKMWGKHFQGISGEIAIDQHGDREFDFSFLDMDQDSGDYVCFANYFGNVKQVVFKKNPTIHWPNNAGPPLNIPVCGFLGDDPKCEKSVISSEGMIAGITAACLFVFVVVTLCFYRKLKLEADLQSQWWRVRWCDLQTVHMGSKTGSRMSSMQSSMPMGSRSEAMTTKIVSLYKDLSVTIKTLKMAHLNIDRKLLLELKHIRDIPCNNLTRFYGLCTDNGHVSILWEHCTRGSLQDMLHNDAIKLDKAFKLSLMNDIISGMCYIHGSPLECHGRLSSSNCLIDGRFVLKITDFGLQSLRHIEISPSKLNKHVLLYVAPEHIDTFPSGYSQPGDVLSFAIVLYELLTRTEPYEADLDVCTIADLLIQIKRTGSSKRPDILSIDFDPSLIRLLQDCWRECPSERPTFNVVRRKTKEMFRTNFGRNILDTLLHRMEQYANNLEGLVEDRTQALLDEKRKSEELLLEILPRSVADRLKNGQTVAPESFDSVTIYFSDIVGFTTISAMSEPMQVIDFLNDLYTCFDKIIEHFKVYKVETIGDAYMVVSGLPVRNGHEHVREIARMALSILDNVKHFQIRHLPDTPLRARIGFHTGPVCTGVVGRKMPRYCLFGDTVNTASRMESNGEAMKIHISETTMSLLCTYGNFRVEYRDEINVKGKGLMKTYWLLSERVSQANLVENNNM